MTGYVSFINYIGSGYTVIILALFSAIGAVLSYIFLKGKMDIVEIVGLVICIALVIG